MMNNFHFLFTGSYDAQRYNAGGDYAESDSANVEHNDRQTPKFGKRPEADATASGTFINQNNQPFVGQLGQEDGSSDSQDVSNGFGPSSAANKFDQAPQPARIPSTNGAFGASGTVNGFGQTSQPGRAPSSNNAFRPSGAANNGFRQTAQPTRGPSGSDAYRPSNNLDQTSQPNRASSANGFGSRKEYLPPVNGFNQNGRPERPSAVNAQANLGFNAISQNSQTGGNGQNNQGSQPSASFVRPGSNRLEVLAQSSGSESQPGNTDFESASNGNNMAQAGQFSQASAQAFGSQNEYLPPTFGQNSRPQGLRPQRPTQSADVTTSSSFNAASQASSSPSMIGSNSQSPQSNGFQKRPQSLNTQFTQNRFSSSQGEQNEGSLEQTEENQNSEVSNGFGSFSQRPTSQPSTELTTPFESNEESQSNTAGSSSAPFNGFGSQSPSTRPGSKFESQTNGQSPLTSSRPQNQVTGSKPQTSFSSQGQAQFGQSSFAGNQLTTQSGFDQKESEDAQFSPSTARPSFSQAQGQAQGPDHSYYYRQPAEPFNTPSGSRFPGATSGQFNRVSQQSAQSTAQVFGTSPQNSPVQSSRPQNQFNRGSTRYPEPPTLAPTAPTGSSDGQFQGSTISSQYNGITQASISPFQPQNQGSTKYPRPPTLSPTAPTLASQFNRITQATASSFTSSPSGSRPTFQQTSFNQPQSVQPSKPFAPQSESEDDVSQGPTQEVPTQQYNGEIYEYSKPPQGLPSPAQKEPTTAPQRGQNFPSGSQARPQFGSTQDTDDQELNAQPARPTFGSRPQRPQFNSFNPQSPKEPSQESNPQFNAQRPFAQSQTNPAATLENRPKCCQSLDNKLQSFRGTVQSGSSVPNQFTNQFSVSQSSSVGGGQGQFGAQFTAPASQASQNFAGRGETFGGPRKPPSFDEQTGYHY